MGRLERQKDWVENLDDQILRWLWDRDRVTTGPAGLGVRVLRVAYMSTRNTITDRVPFQAAALTFMTLLALVPAMAISFSVAKGLGFADTLKRLLINSEFTAGQTEVFQHIIGYVENTRVGTLGAVGLAILVITLVITLASVEETFNRIWNVRATRSWARRFTDYLSVLIIVPLLLLLSTGLWATVTTHSIVREVMNMEVVGQLAEFGMSMGPLMVLAAALTFFYKFLPNTRIPFKSAAVAGVVAAILWWGVQTAYINFQVGVARYNAIYGGFASLPLFLVWLQMTWNVVLLGAELAHAHHVCRYGPLPRYLLPPMGLAQREALAMRILYRTALRFAEGGQALSTTELAHELEAPERDLNHLVGQLIHLGLMVEVGEEGRVQPGRSLDGVTLAEALTLLRGQQQSADACALDEVVCRFLDQADLAGNKVLGETTLLDLVKMSPAFHGSHGDHQAPAQESDQLPTDQAQKTSPAA